MEATKHLIIELESKGFFQCPYIEDSYMFNALIDESISFDNYISVESNWFSMRNVKYTYDHMCIFYKIICEHRNRLKSAINKYLSFNKL